LYPAIDGRAKDPQAGNSIRVIVGNRQRSVIMSKFVIQPHGRLQEWVADEKGYFRDEGLDYVFRTDDGWTETPKPESIDGQAPVKDVVAGAFEAYTEGHGRKGEGAGDVSCACHWTVNQAARLQEGVMWGSAYSIGDAAIMVAGDSDIRRPEDLAGREVVVGYHSGSHYSAIQGLEPFLKPGEIRLKFGGFPWARVDLALARKVEAVNVWGPQRYLLEQQGFRRLVDTTFMMAFMFPRETKEDDVERYMRALRRAQMDIDLEPERYKHYFLNEIPARFRSLIDARRCGVGERVVFLPYTRAMFDKTQAWMHDRKLFDTGRDVGVPYEQAVRT
jgi:NitT/TauT family transport system substrate-binding protein